MLFVVHLGSIFHGFLVEKKIYVCCKSKSCLRFSLEHFRAIGGKLGLPSRKDGFGVSNIQDI